MKIQKRTLLEFRNVDVTLSGKKVLEDVSFSLSNKEIVTLIGLNGTGKTTLLRTIIGVYEPAKGKIILNTKRIGYVPQRLDFDKNIPFSVEELLLTYSGRDRVAILEKLVEVGAAQLIDKKIGMLSGGELQRVLIANALLQNPELLLLDEPTSGIDVMGEQNFYQLIAELFEKYDVSIMMVSHDIHAVFSRSSRVLCISGGIKCYGTPQDVSNHPAFKAIFGDYLSPYHHHHD